MKTDKNTWKGFLFFFLRLISVALVVVGLFFAYQHYQSKVAQSNYDLVINYLDSVGVLDYVDTLNDLLKKK